jgi:uncharacterized protein YdeI (YjbR/CyaY-like superfamily)
MRKQADVGLGDQVRLVLEVDTSPRTVSMPQEFVQALEENPPAKAAFERLPPSHQKEILTYLNWVKRPETRKRNIEKAIASLLKHSQVEPRMNAEQQPPRLTRPLHPMPESVRNELLRRGLLEAYRARPPYQQNDYIGWINRAKRDETRQKRLAQMLDELAGGDRYMNMPYRARKPAG